MMDWFPGLAVLRELWELGQALRSYPNLMSQGAAGGRYSRTFGFFFLIKCSYNYWENSRVTFPLDSTRHFDYFRIKFSGRLVAGRVTAFAVKGRDSMNILWTALLGLASGFVAKLIYPGKEHMGMIMTCLLGIAGSFLASYGGQALKLYQLGQSAGFIGSVVGALVILFIYGLFKKRQAR